MRQLKKLWLDEELNTLEVRFDDGGCSIRIRGGDSKRLVIALEELADTIRHLERVSPYNELAPNISN